MNEEDKNEISEIFSLVDQDSSGRISTAELAELTRKLGLDYSKEQLSQMLKEIDNDRNGEIDVEEFIEVVSRQVVPAYSAEQLIKAFRVLADADGNISAKQLEQLLLARTSRPLPPAHVARLVSQLETDANGNLNWMSLVNVMTF
eukprot:TRINITY_DN6740_c0_g1_i1.p1 TRINITY_DN6740_c0_g1~~TRINITY_DN6740_c0_g1_i1.p1  ORF type:complete len:145 (+),score=65.10 TRINITY_DN6740_c0_g1_i1:143-577(+)